MRIWNAQGGQVDACGNATRCVGWLLLQEGKKDQAVIETNAGMLGVERAGDLRVRVDMGQPLLEWHQIPLSQPMDTVSLDLFAEPDLAMPGAVNMGNPHVVFFVTDVETFPVAHTGSRIEFHSLFPEQVNVEFAEIKSRDRMRLLVWERGVGVTKACGTGACAAVVAAVRRGLTERKVTVEMDGGDLVIEWRESDGHVLMTGPVEFEFNGVLETPISETAEA
jgi:diaminopimelate epimerase